MLIRQRPHARPCGLRGGEVEALDCPVRVLLQRRELAIGGGLRAQPRKQPEQQDEHPGRQEADSAIAAGRGHERPAGKIVKLNPTMPRAGVKARVGAAIVTGLCWRRPMLDLIGFDADDTLWHSEPYFQQAHAQFERILGGYLDLADARVHERLLATERGARSRGDGEGLVDTGAVSDWFYSEFPPRRFVDPLTGNEGGRSKQDEEVRQQLF